MFYVTRFSALNVYNSTLYDNFSVKASIAYIENLAILRMYNSTISQNKAVSTGGILIVDSPEINIFSNVTIENNYLEHPDTIIKELENTLVCKVLCFASDGYMQYLVANKTILYDTVFSVFFQIIEAHASITNGSSIRNMEDISVALIFRSTLVMENVLMENLYLNSNAFDILNSNLDITSAHFQNITKQRGHAVTMFEIQSESYVNLNELTYRNNEVGLTSVTDAEIKLYNSVFENVTTEQYLID